MNAGEPRAWGVNVTAFEQYYDIRIVGLPDGYATRRKVDGRLRGPRLKARTLDELAALIEEQPS